MVIPKQNQTHSIFRCFRYITHFLCACCARNCCSRPLYMLSILPKLKYFIFLRTTSHIYQVLYQVPRILCSYNLKNVIFSYQQHFGKIFRSSFHHGTGRWCCLRQMALLLQLSCQAWDQESGEVATFFDGDSEGE